MSEEKRPPIWMMLEQLETQTLDYRDCPEVKAICDYAEQLEKVITTLEAQVRELTDRDVVRRTAIENLNAVITERDERVRKLRKLDGATAALREGTEA